MVRLFKNMGCLFLVLPRSHYLQLSWLDDFDQYMFFFDGLGDDLFGPSAECAAGVLDFPVGLPRWMNEA